MALWKKLVNRLGDPHRRARIDREESRTAWQVRWLEDFAGDVRYALRAFRRSPGFTLAAVLSLALGIGATSAIVAALEGTLWRPLPVEDPDSIVTMGGQSSTLVRQLQDARIFAGVATRISDGLSFQYDDRAERIAGEAVSANYFTTLGVKPILGDAFSDAVRRGEWLPEAVLAYSFWIRRFGGDPRVIGRTIRLNTIAFTIVGVSPPGFTGMIRGADPELRIPVMPMGRTLSEIRLVGNAGSDCTTCQYTRWMVFARLAPGTTLAHAEAAADVVFQRYRQTLPVQESRREIAPRLTLAPGRLGWNGQDVQRFATSNPPHPPWCRHSPMQNHDMVARMKVDVSLAEGFARGRWNLRE